MGRVRSSGAICERRFPDRSPGFAFEGDIYAKGGPPRLFQHSLRERSLRFCGEEAFQSVASDQQASTNPASGQLPALNREVGGVQRDSQQSSDFGDGENGRAIGEHTVSFLGAVRFTILCPLFARAKNQRAGLIDDAFPAIRLGLGG